MRLTRLEKISELLVEYKRTSKDKESSFNAG